MTDGDHRGDDGAWRPPETPSPAPEPTEEPPPPPPPRAVRRAGEPSPPGAAAGPYDAAGEPPSSDEEEGGRALRPKLVLAIVAAVLVIAIPVGLAIVAAMSAPDTEDRTATDAEEPADPGADDPDEDEDEGTEDLAADLDLEALSGRDEAFGRLLTQVDASERAMIGFQGTVEEAFADAGATEPEELIERIRAAAESGSEGLAEVRPGIATEADDPDVDEVRSVYLEHHDVWADYLEEVANNPAVLAGEDGAQWSLAINASAEAFERTLREHLDGLDDEVRDLGESILDRGFDRGDVRPDA